MARYFLDNPPTEIIVGDCRDILPTLTDGAFDLGFADPPFNYGVDYDTWNDSMSKEKYLNFTFTWIDLLVPKLSSRGSMFIHVPDEVVSYIDVYVQERHHLERINWNIWHYRFGQWTDSRFIPSKCHLLYYAVKKESRIWHPEAVLEPSDRASVYGDARTSQSRSPGLRVPLDVWCGPNLGRVQGNNSERWPNHPNQLPEKYLERILRSSTNPDSAVLDPFFGSGTTGVVARALGLQSTGIEISEDYARSAFDRLHRGAVRIKA